MTTYTLYTEATAPEASKPILRNIKEAFGFVPNLSAVFAESPAISEGYGALAAIFDKTDFTPTERQIILMTNNRLNGCTYCMAAHTTIAQMQSVPEDVVEALRRGKPISDPKLEALRVFSAKVNENRGVVSDADVDAFIAAGYSKASVLDVILGTSLKVLSNYTNHVAKTPVDEAFKANEWTSKTLPS